MRIIDGHRCDHAEQHAQSARDVIENLGEESLISDPRCGLKSDECIEEKLQRALKYEYSCTRHTTMTMSDRSRQHTHPRIFGRD